MSYTFKLVDLNGGTSVSDGNLDFIIGVNGVPELLYGVDVVSQSFEKLLLTRLGSSRMIPTYGSKARELIGAKLNSNILTGLLATIADTCIAFLRDEQASRSSVTDIPPEESILGMEEIVVTYLGNGRIIVEAQIKTKSTISPVVLTLNNFDFLIKGVPNV